MGNVRLQKLLMNWQSVRRNKRGRYKKRWKDNLREGLHRYGLREIETEHGEQWKKILLIEVNLSGEIGKEDDFMLFHFVISLILSSLM